MGPELVLNLNFLSHKRHSKQDFIEPFEEFKNSNVTQLRKAEPTHNALHVSELHGSLYTLDGEVEIQQIVFKNLHHA